MALTAGLMILTGALLHAIGFAYGGAWQNALLAVFYVVLGSWTLERSCR